MKIAFSGTGSISKIHALAARTLGAQLVAVVNHRGESMAQFAQQFGIARQHADVGEMLRAGDVEVLVVGTPNYLHAPETIAALRAGVHVLVEKPMALNAAEARAMLDAGAPTVHPSGFAHPRADHSPQSLYNAQLSYFFDCIRQQRRPVPGAAEGLCNMRIVDAAYESTRSSEVVHL